LRAIMPTSVDMQTALTGLTDFERERAFDPFFTTKPRGVGTGLGLSVAYNVVNEHGGAIAIESQPGEGATFHVYLPILDRPDGAERTPPAADLSTASAAERIVVVDDDETVGLVTQALLERAGYRVQRYTVAVDAIAAVRSDPAAFDLVLTDMEMPLRSGLQVAQEVAAIRAELPVVLITGYLDDALKRQAKQVGVRALVRKEAGFEDLAQVLHKVLSEAA
jgi:CheY-like chemotaxis protein